MNKSLPSVQLQNIHVCRREALQIQFPAKWHRAHDLHIYVKS